MRFRIDLKIFLFLILFYLTKQVEIYAMIMFFCILHELGHLVAGLLMGMKPKQMELMPFGLSISFQLKPKDYNKKIGKGTLLEGKKIVVALAGPLTNIILLMYFLTNQIPLIEQETAIYANILIALFNLLPIYPLDGGRILKSLLHIGIGNRKAKEYTNKTANIVVIILTVISSIGILYLQNIAIFCIISYLWWIVIRENKRYEMKKKLYELIENYA